MKNAFIFTITLAMSALMSHADIIYPDGKAPEPPPYEIHKIGRGIANVLLAPLEITKSIWDASRSDGIMSTKQISSGLFTEGPYKMLNRYASGFYDLGTVSVHNESLMHMEPEFMSPMDVIPGYMSQFGWESIDGGISR